MCYEKIFNPLSKNDIDNVKKEIYNKYKCEGPNYTGKKICRLIIKKIFIKIIII